MIVDTFSMNLVMKVASAISCDQLAAMMLLVIYDVTTVYYCGILVQVRDEIDPLMFMIMSQLLYMIYG